MHEFKLRPTDQQFISVGGMCQILQCLPAQLETLMQACEIENFDLSLDGVCYLSNVNAEAVFEECRKIRAEIESAATSHQRN